MQVDPLLAYLEDRFAFHHVEPFLLAQVEVEGRATWKEVGVLDDEQAAGGFAGGHLEEDGAKS
jgi:hypothetical protein